MRWPIVAIVSIGAGLGCQGGAAPVPEGSTVGQKQAFEAPADGKLTEEQVEMYRSVQAQARLPEGELPGGTGGEALLKAMASRSQTAIETAEQLGYDAAEYQWVQARVMEARLPPGADPGQLAARMSAASLEALEKQREAARDPEEIARLDGEIAGLKTRLSGDHAESQDEAEQSARAYNRELLERSREGPNAPTKEP